MTVIWQKRCDREIYHKDTFVMKLKIVSANNNDGHSSDTLHGEQIVHWIVHLTS